MQLLFKNKPMNQIYHLETISQILEKFPMYLLVAHCVQTSSLIYLQAVIDRANWHD